MPLKNTVIMFSKIRKGQMKANTLDSVSRVCQLSKYPSYKYLVAPKAEVLQTHSGGKLPKTEGAERNFER